MSDRAPGNAEDLISSLDHIYAGCRESDDGERCCVAPSPELRETINKALDKMRRAAPPAMRDLVALRRRPCVGFNDGLIVPGSLLPLGTPPSVARNVALDRAPLRGTVNVAVVLVEFSDRSFGATATQQHFNDLFFSTGVVPTGSVREYYTDVTAGLVTISGVVVGPYMMPQTLASYANGASGTGPTTPNARDLARDAALAADPDVTFANFDNDGDGFVDAYVVIHAGAGAEQTGSGNDIWSHKWVLRSQLNVDGAAVYAYLTVPEDARLGVCAHELGHLLFGFPDLYDTDSSSEGVGNWCLMGGGSWNGSGDTPAHPSAWCKANQGWASVTNVTANGLQTVSDVKTGRTVFRLWQDGAAGQEYFLVENRQRTGFDADLPGDGLLIWHIDDAIASNSDEAHPKVALEQADGQGHLGTGANRGDGGDPYPGSAGNGTFDNSSTPNSRSYAGSNTCVAVTAISPSGPTMTADMRVECRKSALKEVQDKTADKRFEKALRIEKPFVREKSVAFEKPVNAEKPIIDKRVSYDKGWDYDYDYRSGAGAARGGSDDTAARLAALEAAVAAIEPFIQGAMRPDLDASGLQEEDDLRAMRTQMRTRTRVDKRFMDAPGYRR